MPRVERTITLGSVISAITAFVSSLCILVAVTMYVGRLEGRVVLAEAVIAQTAADLAALRAERAAAVQATDGRIRALEIAEGRITTRLAGIEENTRRILEQVERLATGRLP